jgi:MYXO-CTERM domain-containing protein
MTTTSPLRLACLVLAATLAGGAASAAPIPGLAYSAAPVLTGADANFANDPDFLGLTYDEPAAHASTAPAFAENLDVTLLADLDAAGAVGALGGELEVFDASTGSVFLSGTLIQTGFVASIAGEDRIELLFSVTGGSAASSYGPLILAFLTGEFGASAAGMFETGFEAPSTLDLRGVSQVPAPPALGLLLVGLAGLAAVRRKARKPTAR